MPRETDRLTFIWQGSHGQRYGVGINGVSRWGMTEKGVLWIWCGAESYRWRNVVMLKVWRAHEESGVAGAAARVES